MDSRSKVWIEEALPKEEHRFILLHELHRRLALGTGKKYRKRITVPPSSKTASAMHQKGLEERYPGAQRSGLSSPLYSQIASHRPIYLEAEIKWNHGKLTMLYSNRLVTAAATAASTGFKIPEERGIRPFSHADIVDTDQNSETIVTKKITPRYSMVCTSAQCPKEHQIRQSDTYQIEKK